MAYRKIAVVIAMTVGLAFVVGTANSAVLKFEDDDIDFHLDANLNPKSGAFISGDVVVAVFEIPTFFIDGSDAIPAGQELTGVAVTEVAAINGAGVGATIDFVPYSGGMDAVLGLGNKGPVPGGNAGAMLAMWFNGTSGAGGDIDLDLNAASSPGTNCASLADCIEQAAMGDLYQVDGFAGDLDEVWTSITVAGGGLDSSIVAGLGVSSVVAAFNAKLSNIFQNGFDIAYQDVVTGALCGPVDQAGCVQLSVSGTIAGGAGLINGAFAHSDFDAEKLTVVAVPEPRTLSLLGVGLLGLGYLSLRKAATKA